RPHAPGRSDGARRRRGLRTGEGEERARPRPALGGGEVVMPRLDEFVRQLGGKVEPDAGRAVDVRDVQLDSRLVRAGDLFAALPGNSSDGARFVADALARGAAAILSPVPLSPASSVPNWVHADARRIAGEAAALAHGSPARGMFVAAVTGTNGKTTTAHLIG